MITSSSQEKSIITQSPTTATKARRVLPEHEGRYKITLPSGTTQRSKEILAKRAMLQSDKIVKKTSIFERLGNEDRDQDDDYEDEMDNATTTGNSNNSISSVFARLGGKSGQIEMSNEYYSADEPKIKKPLPPPPPATNNKSQKVILIKKIPAKAATMVADEFSMDVGEQQNKSVSFSEEDEVLEIAPRRLVVKPRIKNNGPVGNSVKARLGMKKNGKDAILHKTQKTIKFKADSPKKVIQEMKLKSDQLITNKKIPIHKRLNKNLVSSTTSLSARIGKVSLGNTKTNKATSLKANKSVFNRLG